jgi:CheY-like chemotaxis protein
MRPPRRRGRSLGRRRTTITTTIDAHLILVVDDDDAIRTVAAEVLDDDPTLRTIQACDGAEALALVAAQRPALVLLDLAMPVLDGFEVCRRLRADPTTRAIPIVVMSASERRQAALDAGANEFIAKPFAIDRLAGAVRRWLGLPV